MKTVKRKMRLQRDCKVDIPKFCQDVDPGEDGLVTCIYQYENEVSASCRTLIQADKEESRIAK